MWRGIARATVFPVTHSFALLARAVPRPPCPPLLTYFFPQFPSQGDGASMFPDAAPATLTFADRAPLWALLLIGFERVCRDAGTDVSSGHCIIDSAFWLLTGREQCAALCEDLVALLDGVPITCDLL